MKAMNEQTYDPEAVALARCYGLLLQKARERRARLAAETAVSNDVKQTESQEQEVEDDGRADD